MSKTSAFTIEQPAPYGRIEAGHKLRQQQAALEHSQPYTEVEQMSRWDQYTDSESERNPEHHENTTSLRAGGAE